MITIPLLAVGDLCHFYTSYLTKNHQVSTQAVRVLAQAVVKLRQFDTQLTSVHADLCQISLTAKVFSPAVRILDVDVTAIASTDVSTDRYKDSFGDKEYGMILDIEGAFDKLYFKSIQAAGKRLNICQIIKSLRVYANAHIIHLV